MDLKSPPAPAMDVVSPPAAERPASPVREPEVDPLDKLAAEDKAEQQAQARQEAAKPAKPAAKATKPKQPPSDNGVRMAITGTIIIVLGLAALATYAYLQTVK